MPAARSPADILCPAVYTLAGGKLLRGFMLTTIADRLGIECERCKAMAVAAAKAGLVRHEFGTVALTGEGHEWAATLTAPAVRTSARRRSMTKPPRPRAKPRPGPEA